MFAPLKLANQRRYFLLNMLVSLLLATSKARDLFDSVFGKRRHADASQKARISVERNSVFGFAAQVRFKCAQIRV